MIERVAAFARAQGWNLYDLAVIRGGRAESVYLQDCNRCNDSYSVAKAFTMTAVGMLWDEGKLSLGDFGFVYFIDWDQVRERQRVLEVKIIGE